MFKYAKPNQLWLFRNDFRNVQNALSMLMEFYGQEVGLFLRQTSPRDIEFLPILSKCLPILDTAEMYTCTQTFARVYVIYNINVLCIKRDSHQSAHKFRTHSHTVAISELRFSLNLNIKKSWIKIHFKLDHTQQRSETQYRSKRIGWTDMHSLSDYSVQLSFLFYNQSHPSYTSRCSK